MIQLALFEPQIPQNTGTLIRLASCLGITLDIIEPCGFIFSDKYMKRSVMDYYDPKSVIRHDHWTAFQEYYKERRLILIDVKGEESFCDFSYDERDILIMGREADGVPDHVFRQAHKTLNIPMHGKGRSINMAVAASMVLTEALRNTNYWSES